MKACPQFAGYLPSLQDEYGRESSKTSKAVFLFCILVAIVTIVLLSSTHTAENRNQFKLSSDLSQQSVNVIFVPNSSCSPPPSSYPNIKLLQSLQPDLRPSCKLLFNGDETERKRVRNRLKNWKAPSDYEIFPTLHNCTAIREEFTNNFYVTQEEKEFPIAFEMLMYYQKNRLLQMVRLLKFLYRPQNLYCIHIDQKSPKMWIKGVREFVDCLPNVFVARKLVTIHYGSVSILDAHLSCLRDLQGSQLDWKYVITLHTPELPLKTNRQLVSIFKKLNGNNVVTPGVNASDRSSGTPHNWLFQKRVWNGRRIVGSKDGLGPLPNFTIYKSAESINSAMTREFVKFALTSSQALTLRRRLEYIQSAEEFYFVTLDTLEDAPGNRMKLKKEGLHMPTLSRRLWKWHRKPNECIHKYYRNNICIASASDLPYIKNLRDTIGLWFYNKYLMDYDHVVMDCIEELLIGENFKQYERDCSSI